MGSCFPCLSPRKEVPRSAPANPHTSSVTGTVARTFSLKELAAATRNFSDDCRIIGREDGLYKGYLKSINQELSGDDGRFDKALLEFYVNHRQKRSSDFPICSTFTRYSGKKFSGVVQPNREEQSKSILLLPSCQQVFLRDFSEHVDCLLDDLPLSSTKFLHLFFPLASLQVICGPGKGNECGRPIQ